ncbi:MAG: glycerophosphodiester phosphodiesterase family protein [Acidimicrobiales bacterium]
MNAADPRARQSHRSDEHGEQGGGRRERHPFLVEGRADVLAHRGASSLHPPGNTERAFAAALEMGFDHLETDVQASRDGVVVVFHDERLDEATTGTGAIGDHTWSELRTVRTTVDGRATDDGLVRLDELLERFPTAFFNIDIKTDATVEPAARILVESDARSRVCVAAFGWRRLRRVRRRLGPGWCTAMAKPEIAVTVVAARLRLPVPRLADVVQLPTTYRERTIVDRRLVDACHRSGVAVHVWTVNDPGEASRLQALGVDAVISDRPDLVG